MLSTSFSYRLHKTQRRLHEGIPSYTVKDTTLHDFLVSSWSSIKYTKCFMTRNRQAEAAGIEFECQIVWSSLKLSTGEESPADCHLELIGNCIKRQSRKLLSSVSSKKLTRGKREETNHQTCRMQEQRRRIDDASNELHQFLLCSMQRLHLNCWALVHVLYVVLLLFNFRWETHCTVQLVHT